MESKEFAEFVQRLELREPRPECLTDEQLVALVAGATGEADAASGRGHLKACLACLQAYASLQSLLALRVDDRAPESRRWYEVARDRLAAAWASSMAGIRRAMTVRIPLAWSAGAVVATTLLIHFVAFRPLSPAREPGAPPAITTATERAVAGTRPGDIRTAVAPDPTTSASSPCGSRRWRIESVVTKNLISHLFVCGDGGPDDVVYVISGRPTQVTQRPDQTAAILEQARIQRLD